MGTAQFNFVNFIKNRRYTLKIGWILERFIGEQKNTSPKTDVFPYYYPNLRLLRRSTLSSMMPVPIATQSIGFSAIKTGTFNSSAIN